MLSLRHWPPVQLLLTLLHTLCTPCSPAQQAAVGEAFAKGSRFALEHLRKAQWKVASERAVRVHPVHHGTRTLRWEGDGLDSVRVPTQGCIPRPVTEARKTMQRELRDEQVRYTPEWGDIWLSQPDSRKGRRELCPLLRKAEVTPGSPVRARILPGTHGTCIWDPLFTFPLPFLWKAKLLLNGAMGGGGGTPFSRSLFKKTRPS